MKKLMTMTRQFRDDENGAAMVEYSILIGIIAAAWIVRLLLSADGSAASSLAFARNLRQGSRRCWHWHRHLRHVWLIKKISGPEWPVRE